MEPGKLMSTEEIKFQQTKPIITQNAQNQLYFNPVAMADFDSVVVTPTPFVGFEPLTETEIIIHHIPTLITGAIRLRRSKNKRTGTCSFGPVLAENPHLRVGTGRQNAFKYRIDTLEDGAKRFVLLIAKPDVLPTPERSRKAAATRKQKRAAK